MKQISRFSAVFLPPPPFSVRCTLQNDIQAPLPTYPDFRSSDIPHKVHLAAYLVQPIFSRIALLMMNKGA